MPIFLSIFAYSQGENSNLLTKNVKDMNAIMKHDMEKKLILSDGLKKSYKTPKSLVVEFDREILQYQGSTDNGENGGELSARDRFSSIEESSTNDFQFEDLW